jgi:lipoprotein-releasing system ATP-binding protein
VSGAPVLRAEGLRRVLGRGALAQEVIRGIDLEVGAGELVALTGASGSGKSTLLYLLGVLDRPDAGEVWIEGASTSGLDDDARAALRSRRIGFVFQFHFLLPELDALENVLVPQLKLGAWTEPEARRRAADLLGDLGLGDKHRRRPHELSGGEQQRVAIARALANRPAILLTDEPTGNLDSRNAEHVFEILEGLARDGVAVVVVTHEQGFAARAGRRIHLVDGAVAER